MIIKQITVIGLGLIGSSLAWSIKERRLGRVTGFARRQETVDEACDRGLVDEGSTDLVSSVSGSQVIFLCTTIDSIPDIVEQIKDHLDEGAVLIDVASTKKQLVFTINDMLPDHLTFIGGHPMAGSERTGIESAQKDLFEGAKFILTPYNSPDNAKLLKVNNFLERLGMSVQYMTPDDHDLAVAAISHLPYIIASTLVNTVGNHDLFGSFSRLASTGFKDTTRVSSSSPNWGKNVCSTNKEKILQMISDFKDNLSYLESVIKLNKDDELSRYFEQAKATRDSIFKES